MRVFFLVTCLLAFTSLCHAQTAKNKVSLGDIWLFYKFFPESADDIRWRPDDRFYTEVTEDDSGQTWLLQRSVEDADLRDTLAAIPASPDTGTARFDDYAISADGSHVLLTYDRQSIYRRSYTVRAVVLDRTTGTITPIHGLKAIGYPSFSPDGTKLAFTHANDLWYVDLNTGEHLRITTDGKRNAIINGSADWVHEEEFAFAQAFYWAPSSTRLVYYRFDETAVPEFGMTLYNGLYPENYQFKYPKAGDANAQVDLFVYDLDLQEAKPVELPTQEAGPLYVPRLWWMPEDDVLYLWTLNRHQNHGYLFRSNPFEGGTTLLLEEEAPQYFDEPTDQQLVWVKTTGQFLWQSEKSGYNHVYLHNPDGAEVLQLTTGEWEVTDVYGVDETSGYVYYQSAEASPLQRQVYSIRLDGKKKKLLTEMRGWHEARFSDNFSYFIHEHSSANTVPTATLRETKKAKPVEPLVDNDRLQNTLSDYQLSPKRFFNFTTEAGVSLNGWMIRPTDFDSLKRYPVLMFVYGGPGSQTVEDQWDAFNRFWFQHLADQGILVVSVDNRGTGGRGRDFQKCTYLNLGKLETQDQIAAANYLAGLRYVDGARIGIFGWSYGGYMAANCITQGAAAFSTAVAVAPVTNWRFYDTIYTERYMRTPQENAAGYDENSPLRHVKKLQGDFLLIHGTGDDNVHVQNSMELTNALVAANKQFRQFFYPDRNHAIFGGTTRYHLYQQMTDFLLETLGVE